MKLKDKLTVPYYYLEGKDCNSSPEQDMAVRILFQMFYYHYFLEGMLDQNWPYATYYATQLQPLEFLSAHDVCLPDEGFGDEFYVCFKNKCASCIYNAAYGHLDRPREDVDQVNDLCDKVDESNFPPKGAPDPEKNRTIQAWLSASINSRSTNVIDPFVRNLTWKDIKWIRTTLERKPKGKFEICEDAIPLAVAAQNLWQLFNLTHQYSSDDEYVSEDEVRYNMEKHVGYYTPTLSEY